MEVFYTDDNDRKESSDHKAQLVENWTSITHHHLS